MAGMKKMIEGIGEEAILHHLFFGMAEEAVEAEAGPVVEVLPVVLADLVAEVLVVVELVVVGKKITGLKDPVIF